MSKTIMSEDVLNKIQLLSNQGNMHALLSIIDDFIESGIDEGAFTRQEADSDMKLALWISYADINIDEYECYLHALSRLEPLKNRAEGCGVWYYRYSTCLMYTNALEEALIYSEMGVKQEPDYSLGWFLLASLRNHFGDKNGALEAINTGLHLTPDSNEFLTRRKYIENNKSMMEMELALSSGESSSEERFKRKLMSISSIVCNEPKLNKIVSALGALDWDNGGPYCDFSILLNTEDEIECEFEMNQASVSNLFDESWITEFVDSILSMDSEARERIQDFAGARINMEMPELDWISIYRDKSICITYLAQETDEFIYVGFDSSFCIKDGVEFEQGNKLNVEMYDEEERNTVEEHIADHMGEYSQVMYEMFSPDINVDICLIEPLVEEYRDYYTLVTCGMGAHIMELTKDAEGKVYDRAELFLCLPSDWDVKSEKEEWYWPIRCLKILARYPGNNNTFLGWGHTMSLQEEVTEDVSFNSFVLLGPQECDDQSGICELPLGDKVAFYQVIPLYNEEKEYKLQHGIEALLERMSKVEHVIDVTRENTCKGFVYEPQRKVKKFFLSLDEMKPLLEGYEGPQGCIATDRIVVEGGRVGYMYREELSEELNSDNYPDSGWRFTAGDESTEYMQNAGNSGIYHLNTICNYDPEIIPFLEASIGSAFYRDDNGEWKKSKDGQEGRTG